MIGPVRYPQLAIRKSRVTMYPSRTNIDVRALLASKRTGKRAEASVYETLARKYETDQNVNCFWSYAISSGEKEHDFLVVHKQLGFAVIEVKGIPLITAEDGSWCTFDPATGVICKDKPYESNPVKQAGAAVNAIKSWWKKETNSDCKPPRAARIIVLAGVKQSDWYGETLTDAKVRPIQQQCHIVFHNEVERLPSLIESWLSNLSPERVTNETHLFWEKHLSTFANNCGICVEEDRELERGAIRPKSDKLRLRSSPDPAFGEKVSFYRRTEDLREVDGKKIRSVQIEAHLKRPKTVKGKTAWGE